jgi:glycine/D-amino acid oxidase-like deaminating enzyme
MTGMADGGIRNGNVSFWWTQLGLPGRRLPLPGSVRADVCIVGAGFTGLWTAYYLKRAAPHLDVVVLESQFAGYGASGRNGGWLTNTITGGRDRYLDGRSRGEIADMQRVLNDAVDEVIRVAGAEGIDARIVKGGELTVATSPAQLRRMHAFAQAESAWPATDLQVLSARATGERVAVRGALGGVWHPHCARIDPARLVRGLARAVEALGVRIHEDTTVREIRPHEAVTNRGTVTADVVVRATEGFTANLRGQHRTWLPMNSSLVVTEPLAEDVWDAIGWHGRELLGDFAHVYMYAQRTADDRIALGGRGAPYRFGSRTDTDGATPTATIEKLRAILTDFFPATAGAAIEHAWSGVLGVPRDWAATMGLDRTTGLAWAGGYVGTGVTTTNVAGRTLADLILEHDSQLTRLPWVGHVARKWEPEPLRWLAVQGIYAAYGAADRIERSGRPRTATIAKIADAVAGRH